MKNKKWGHGEGWFFCLVAGILIVCGIGYASYITWGYWRGRNKYQTIQDSYTYEYVDSEEITGAVLEETDNRENTTKEKQSAFQTPEMAQEALLLPEDAPERIAVDWAALLADYSSVAAWIQLPALELEYPVMQAQDNEYFLHRAPDETSLFAGSIFLDSQNSPGLENYNTLVYGHNMRDGSMFAKLSRYADPDVLSSCPYFWLYTPAGDFLYRIFSVHCTSSTGNTYTIRFPDYASFCEWRQEMLEASDPDTGFPETELDSKDNAGYGKVVTLSTCTGDSSIRQTVQGLLIWQRTGAKRDELMFKTYSKKENIRK